MSGPTTNCSPKSSKKTTETYPTCHCSDTTEKRTVPSKPLSLMKRLIGNCVCVNPFQPGDHRGELSPSNQLVELHGIQFIGLGSLSDELTPRERVYDTLEQLTTRTDRLISVGYILLEEPDGTLSGDCRYITETVPLDVWNHNFPNDRSMNSDVRLIIDHVRNGELSQLEKQLEKQLESQISNLHKGNKAFLSGITAHNLGVAKVLLGKETEAEVLFRRAITLKEAAFSAYQHEIALSWNELGIQYFARCDFEGALAAFQRSHELESSSSTNDATSSNQELAMVLNNIACCYFQMGRHREAHQALLEARHIQHEIVGMTAKADLDLLCLATVMCNCGYLKLALRQYEEARPLLEEALLIQQSVLDDNHRAVRDTRSNIEFANVFHSD